MGNSKTTPRQRGGEKSNKEVIQLQTILKNVGFWPDLELQYYQICDRVDEMEHGWPVIENLRKAFQDIERQIQAKGWKNKFVSSTSYHRYQRLKNDLLQAGNKKKSSNIKQPTLPKKLMKTGLREEGVQDYKQVLEEQLSQAQAQVKALKQQLDRLQDDLVEFHTSQREVDQWISKLIDQNNAILSTHTYMSPGQGDVSDDVMAEVMEEINPLPANELGRKHDSKDILESTHRWMEYLATILPEYYEMKTVYDRYKKVKESVLMFGPVPPLTTRTEYEVEQTPRGKGKKRKIQVMPVEDEGDGLVRLLQDTQDRLKEQENAIIDLQEDNEFLRKKLRTGEGAPHDAGAGPSGEPAVPQPTFGKQDEADRRELLKRNPRNPEYLDALMTQIKRQKAITRRIDRLKMNVVIVKLHGGYDEENMAGPMTQKDDGTEFDSLLVMETNNKVMEDTIPELENLLLLATVGQKLLETVDTMYTHFCSDILNDNKRLMEQLGQQETNAEADTASNIVTKYRQKLEDIQVTLLRNRDDIVQLQKEKSGLEKKALELRETKRSMKKIEKHSERIAAKLVRKTGTELVREDPDVADVVGFKKGKTIWQKYKEMYEFEWFDAYDLEKEYLEKAPREGVDTLLHILKDCFLYCQKEADDQWEQLKDVIFWEKKKGDETSEEKELTEQDIKYLRNIRKNYMGSTELIEEHFREHGMSPEYEKEQLDDKFKPYIKKITELCWFMAIQDPPMHLFWEIKYAEFVDKTLFENFTFNGRRYDFLVWPAMMLYKDGPLLTKGIIQPIFLD